MQRKIVFVFLVLAACSRTPRVPEADVPARAEAPAPVQTPAKRSGPTFGISTSGRPGVNLGPGVGLHIDYKGRVGLGWGF